MSKSTKRLQSLLFSLFLFGGLLIVSCGEETITYTFRFDNRNAAYEIKTLTIAGDFNEWEKTKTALQDLDNDSIWQAEVSLTKGWYNYRFVINGERWLKDPENQFYSGKFSNSLVYADTIKYPYLQEIQPASGSWLYIPPDSLIFNFAEAGKDTFEAVWEIDGNISRWQLVDSVITLPFPVLFDGRSSWKISLLNKNKQAVHLKEGLWFINYENQKPRADAGYTQFAHLGDTVSLNGGKSFDPDFEVLTDFNWRQISGPAKIKLENRASPFAQFISNRSGSYGFHLTVQDSAGLQASDITEVIVLPQNRILTGFEFKTDTSAASIKTAALVGEFNLWNNNTIFLCPNSDSSLWKTEILLANGRYEYKYVLNGQDWIVDPGNELKVPDGWQGFNSVKEVTANLLLNLNFVRDSIQTKNELNVGAVVKNQSGAEIIWAPDIQNQNSRFRQDDGRLIFDKRNPEGNYFFYCLVKQMGYSFPPRTLHIQHFRETIISDFDASPSWADTSVIYEIYLRRFGRQPNFNGLTQSLPQLKKLGVNVLWLMPVYNGPTDHGYAPVNLFAVEKDYGTMEDYRRFIKEAHSKGFKVIFDFVANHISDQHLFVKAAADNLHSPLRKWFYWRPDGSWGYHNDWDTLVNLNFNLPMVRHHLLNAARFWLGLGIDGFRCDVAWAVPHDFWKDFRREVKKINSGCLIIDEVLPRQPAFHEQEFDMSYDTDFYGNLLDIMNKRKPLSALDYGLQKTAGNYPPEAQSLRYMENHDMQRFIKQFGPEKTRLMAAVLLTIPGTPLIYYGQENGEHEERPDFILNERSKWFDFYNSLIKFRLNNPALTSGDFKTIKLDDKDELWIYERSLAGQEVRVIINLSKQRMNINIPEKHTIIFNRKNISSDSKGNWIIKPESFLISGKNVKSAG